MGPAVSKLEVMMAELSMFATKLILQAAQKTVAPQ